MPCLVEFAELCDASYQDAGASKFVLRTVDRRRPSGIPFDPSLCATSDAFVSWDRRFTWENRHGFYAVLFERKGEGSVLAFRGTDDLWDGLRDDVRIAAGAMPPQAVAAIQVVRSAPLDSTTALTGHSLGGALALIAAAHSGRAAVTFNAPGVLDACVASAGRVRGLLELMRTVGRCASNGRVKNIRIEGDPVSSMITTGLQVGSGRNSLPAAQCGMDILCRHGIRTCIAAVRREERNYESLSL